LNRGSGMVVSPIPQGISGTVDEDLAFGLILEPS